MILILVQIIVILFVVFVEKSMISLAILVIAMFGIYGKKLVEYKLNIIGPILIPSITKTKMLKYLCIALGSYYIQKIKIPDHDNIIIVSLIVLVVLIKSRVHNDI